MNAIMNSEGAEEIREAVSRTRRFGRWCVDEVRWLLRVLISAGDRFYWDNGFSKAASLAYTSLLSLVPATALIFNILGSFIVSDDVNNVRRFILGQFVPGTAASAKVLEYLQEFSVVMSSLNMLVIAFLVITFFLLINSIEAALNEVWQVYEPRTIANRVKIFSAILIIGPVLALSAYWFASYSTLRLQSVVSLWSDFDTLYREMLQFLIDSAAFFALYYLVPKAPVKAISAAFGAFVTAICFGAAKSIFVVYVERFASYDAVYGALAAVPVFLIWLYLAWSVVLFGAECSYQVQYLPKSGKIWKRSVLALGDGSMLLAVQSLIIIGRAFRSGDRMPNDWEIAEKLGCSSTVLKPAISALERAAIITRGDSRDMPLTLLKSPEKVAIADIRTALFGPRTCLHYPREITRMFSSFDCDDEGGSKATLADILNDRGV